MYLIKNSCWIESKQEIFTVSNLKKKGNLFYQVDTMNLENLLNYQDMNTEMHIDLYENDTDIFDFIKVDIRQLYITEKEEYDVESSSGRKISFSLKLPNKPRYVQSPTGVYFGFGSYTDYTAIPGSFEIDIHRNNIMQYNEPIAEPYNGAVKTFKPFVFAVTRKIKVINS